MYIMLFYNLFELAYICTIYRYHWYFCVAIIRFNDTSSFMKALWKKSVFIKGFQSLPTSVNLETGDM